jgi:hypothetical protein
MLVGVTGHQNLPASGIFEIARLLRNKLSDVEHLTGISSLAAGADQLFAEILLELGGALLVVVPSSGYETTFANPSDLARFRGLIEKAATVEQLQFPEPTEAAFSAAGRRVVDLSERVIALWDGLPARGLGGTADVVGYAHTQSKDVTIIWPDGLTR